jgi:hypothetical protein
MVFNYFSSACLKAGYIEGVRRPKVNMGVSPAEDDLVQSDQQIQLLSDIFTIDLNTTHDFSLLGLQ